MERYPNKIREESRPEEGRLARETREFLKGLCRDFKDPQKRIREIRKRLDLFDTPETDRVISQEALQEVRADVEKCGEVESPDAFIEAAMKALRSIVDIAEKYPKEFEVLQGELINRERRYIPLNDLVSYGKSGDRIHLHHTPGRTKGVKEKITTYKSALENLARIVKEDPEIRQVTATSWIVGEHPVLFSRFGFTISGEVTSEFKKRHFPGETSSVMEAIMSREDFLERFLK